MSGKTKIARRASAVVVSLMVGSLVTGCATGASEGDAGPTPSVSASPTSTSVVDANAEAKAQSWLDAARLPPGAVRSESAPSTSVSFNTEVYHWWCNPMEELTAYWTIAGATVTDTANWLSEHPTADLIVPGPVPAVSSAGSVPDIVSLGNVPFRDSLEGISFTVVKTRDGVAVRAQIGVIPENAECPTPEPGVGLGGPGQG